MTDNRYYAGPPSDHFDGQRFFNPNHPSTDPSLRALLRWRFGEARAAWPKSVPGRQTVPNARVPGLRITMIGHASFLIQVAGRNLLVDPVWSERASPVRWAGPCRVNPPGVAFEALPPIDAVLLTHNHYDHLDLSTLQRLWQRDRAQIITPLGNDSVIHAKHRDIAVATYDWGDKVDLGDGLVIWLHPANHWSARGFRDRRMALWCGFVITSPVGTIYVCGDTGYGDGGIFRDIKTRYPAIDVALLPIGAYEPRWFMTPQHVNPAEAVQIMQDTGATQALGVHWGTFQLTDEPRLAPKEALIAELARRRLDETSFLAMESGDVWNRPGDNSR